MNRQLSCIIAHLKLVNQAWFASDYTKLFYYRSLKDLPIKLKFSFKTPWVRNKFIRSGFLVIRQLSFIIAYLKISVSSSIFDLKHLGVEINLLDMVF